MVFLPIVHRNNCQITHLIWNLGAHSTLGSSVREAGGALLSNPHRLYHAHFILVEPRCRTSGKRKAVPTLRAQVTCVPGQQQQFEGPSMSHAGQLRSPPALPAPPWPLGLAPPWSASSFPPPPGWAQRETRQRLLAELSSCCAGVGLSKTTKRFALDSLAFFFFKLSLSVTPSLLPSWGPSSAILLRN